MRADWKVEVKDGRVLEGDFWCLDKQGNIVMNNTQQLSDRYGGGAHTAQAPVFAAP